MREEAGNLFERRGELRVFFGVFFGETSYSGCGLGDVVVEEERFAVGPRREDAGIWVKNFATEFFELKIAGDAGTERAYGVSES